MEDSQEHTFMSEQAQNIRTEVSGWLKQEGNGFVPSHLVQQYAICKARWRFCEKEIEARGLLVKDPSTGRAIASPYIAISEKYMHGTVKAWDRIQREIKVATGKSVSDDATLF